ncbi:CRR6 family NdhI maturation factor [Microcoleus sp. FACHB-1515]|uniref:CRR6 family NdhI maturation factor n=1 Tax=Cyanophyceae TaxID=3028117 RepID=UPI0016854A4C|nr:CRR6 family NdhI maturation factor [Microcoleus sp. FACHB-1515]MBD2089474.1 CRR6 family NdhI maturation factor [Microcoleus sp. FACHB-1515]
MTTTISLQAQHFDRLDLSPLTETIEPWLQAGEVPQHEQDLAFAINFPREAGDPRELSEIPEVRLWFLRADARYPWLPWLLSWENGELTRYAAMLVPHQFNKTEGIQYNPEALELFVMNKVFVLADWLQQQGAFSPTKLRFMTQTLGYDLDEEFFILLG